MGGFGATAGVREEVMFLSGVFEPEADPIGVAGEGAIIIIVAGGEYSEEARLGVAFRAERGEGHFVEGGGAGPIDQPAAVCFLADGHGSRHLAWCFV